jgi:transposase-like protein
MKGRKHTPEQIIARLREAEAELNGGATIGQVCQKLSISEQTFHRWRNPRRPNGSRSWRRRIAGSSTRWRN